MLLSIHFPKLFMLGLYEILTPNFNLRLNYASHLYVIQEIL